MKQVELTFTQLLLGVPFMPPDVHWQIVLRQIELALNTHYSPDTRCFAFFYKDADLSDYPVTEFIPPKRYVYCKAHKDLCEGRIVVKNFPRDPNPELFFPLPPPMDPGRRFPGDPLPGIFEFLEVAVSDGSFSKVYAPNGTFSAPSRAVWVTKRMFKRELFE